MPYARKSKTKAKRRSDTLGRDCSANTPCHLSAALAKESPSMDARGSQGGVPSIALQPERSPAPRSPAPNAATATAPSGASGQGLGVAPIPSTPTSRAALRLTGRPSAHIRATAALRQRGSTPSRTRRHGTGATRRGKGGSCHLDVLGDAASTDAARKGTVGWPLGRAP